MSEYLGFEPTDQAFYYFISYNHEDAGRVGVLAKQLNDLGVPFWYDYGLEVSDPWDPQLADKISNSQAVVLFFTKGVLDKEESFVQTEYEIAKFYDKRIYTLIMDPITKTDIPKNNLFRQKFCSE